MTDATTAKPARKPRKSAAAAAAHGGQAVDEAVAAASSGGAAIREQLAATRDTIRDEAQRKAGEIGDEVGRLYNQAGERARDVANLGKTKAAGGLETLAKVIEDSAPQVDGTLGKTYGDFARSAAQSVGETRRLARRGRNRGTGRLDP